MRRLPAEFQRIRERARRDSVREGVVTMWMKELRAQGKRTGPDHIRRAGFTAVAGLALLLGGCGIFGGKDEPEVTPAPYTASADDESGGLRLFGDDKREVMGIGVNSYLWRAALDTMAFMPISSADPFGGVIITDWYSDPQTPNERFKINVFILSRQLRADGLRVAVFRQNREPERGWTDAPVSGETTARLENAILARARQLWVDRPSQ